MIDVFRLLIDFHLDSDFRILEESKMADEKNF